MRNNINELSINTIRALSVDQVQAANSGHPGAPLGMAPLAYTLWTKHMNFNPEKPDWINRDRFVLSAGHASALYYSLLHLMGYDLSIEDLKNFRQIHSKTPGHPEIIDTAGIDVSTGPLGAGLATSVGLAMAQEHLSSTLNKENLINNYTYVLAGDGCMMEGVSSEASSLAGTLALSNLIIFYDSNNITIEGSTDLAFNENVRARYEAYGFETYLVEDGNDIEEIDRVITLAKSNKDKPSFIEVKTKIGYGSELEGTSKVHGAPLGKDGVNFLKEKLNYPSQDPFFVPEEVYEHFKEIKAQKIEGYNQWEEKFEKTINSDQEFKEQWTNLFTNITLEELLDHKELFEFDSKDISTRVASGEILNKINSIIPNLIGGSADLSPSNMTALNNEEAFSKDNYAGKNLHYGVRENAMGAIGNGLVLYGGLKSYVATFFVFSDFLKPMLRLSSLMELPLTYVLTHDSIGVGEDGPTHQPIEQLLMLRSQPNLTTFRPADAKETAFGWAQAITSEKTPTALVLSRQNLPILDGSSKESLKGGYIIKEASKETIDVLLMASGSEVSACINVADTLEAEGYCVRVVSMPSFELFNKQDKAYKEKVLPKAVRSRVSVEAGATLSWGQYVGLDGLSLGIDRFGLSGKGDDLFDFFNLTEDKIKTQILEYISK